MSILLSIIGFFVGALALKLALGVLGQPGTENKYSTALTVSGVLAISSLLLSFVPLFGWLLYAVLWLAVVKSVYRIGFGKSLIVALLQLVIRGGIWFLLHLIF